VAVFRNYFVGKDIGRNDGGNNGPYTISASEKCESAP